MIKNILVPTDFSFCSKQGLRYAVSLAGKFQATITVLHVLDQKLIDQSCHFGLGEEGKVKEIIWKRTKQNLEEFLKDEKFGGIQVQETIVSGVPFQEIVKKAQQIKADLIILGGCGGTVDLDRLFFGSTAEKVVRLLPCPVLCVPPKEL
jgi:nucleotide-binding universal stress UspA family protein